MITPGVRQRPGVQPFTEAELAGVNPGALRASRSHVRGTLISMARGPLATSFLLPLTIRRRLLRLAGLQIGATVTGLANCGFETKHVSIGEGSFVNVRCWVEGRGRVDIGRNVLIGPEVMILTSIHEIDSDGRVTRMPVRSQVRIGDGCWLGARALIMPGVTIGEGTIIGAGAVVTKDCEPGAVYVGVPARRVR